MMEHEQRNTPSVVPSSEIPVSSENEGMHDSSPETRATAIVACAVDYLVERFGTALDHCVSAGVLGSMSRNELRATSDIDFYVVFDELAVRSANAPSAKATMEAAIGGLVDHVLREHGHEPLGARFSVYCTSRECLEQGRYDTGRFPPYDRRALATGGKHLAGRTLAKDSLAPVPRELIVTDGARFLVEVLREKLASARLFEKLPQLEGVELGGLGSVVLTKAVTMPIRFLYVLGPVPDPELVTSTEVAVAECRKRYGQETWWPLVLLAMRWRETPPARLDEWRAAAEALREHLTDLYLFFLERYSAPLDAREEHLSRRLSEWRDEIIALRKSWD
jgi:predicted nucleotidyltransferase